MPVLATTPQRVRNLLVKQDTGSDDLFLQMIQGVSKEIESYIGYEFEQKQRTEEYTVNLHQRGISLRNMPVVTVDDVRWDPLNVWPASTAIDAANYHVDLAAAILILRSEYGPAYRGLQVTYTAGLATSTFDMPANAPDIAYACELQVAEDWRRKDSMNASRRGGAGGGKAFKDSHCFLERVRELLEPRVRLMVGGDG